VESISQLYVRANPKLGPLAPELLATGDSGGTVLTRIDNVARFERVESASRIDRLNRQRMVAVRANIAGDYALADRIEALKAAAEEIGLPPGYNYQVLGNGREMERTLADFGWTIV